MEAPDKIYLHGYEFDDEPCKSWEREPKVKGMRGYPALHVSYIRKEALLEWKEELEEHVRKCAGGIVGRYEHGYWKALDDLIDKLNKL